MGPKLPVKSCRDGAHARRVLCPLQQVTASPHRNKPRVPSAQATWQLTIVSSNPLLIPRRKFCPYLRTSPVATGSALSMKRKSDVISLSENPSTALFFTCTTVLIIFLVKYIHVPYLNYLTQPKVFLLVFKFSQHPTPCLPTWPVHRTPHTVSLEGTEHITLPHTEELGQGHSCQREPRLHFWKNLIQSSLLILQETEVVII